jgi:hypothetical protein
VTCHAWLLHGFAWRDFSTAARCCVLGLSQRERETGMKRGHSSFSAGMKRGHSSFSGERIKKNVPLFLPYFFSA